MLALLVNVIRVNSPSLVRVHPEDCGSFRVPGSHPRITVRHYGELRICLSGQSVCDDVLDWVEVGEVLA